MKIAVLGWGSLIWDRRNLRIAGGWFEDGPCLPIEFARVSKDGRLTLVLFPHVEKGQVLWAYMDTDDLEEAIKNLKERECTKRERIGFVEIASERTRFNVVPDVVSDIKEWLNEKSIDAVIWTDLCPNFEKETGAEFIEDEVVKYLENLQPHAKRKAEKYIRKAPPQIRTKMREIIEESLGWTYKGNGL